MSIDGVYCTVVSFRPCRHLPPPIQHVESVGCRPKKSLWLAVQLSESVHEKRNGSEGPKQTIEKANLRFHLTPALDTGSGNPHELLFWMTNTHYRRLLVRRVIATHACTVRTCFLAVGWSLCGVFQCKTWPRRRRREATWGDVRRREATWGDVRRREATWADVPSGRVLWCQFGV